MTIVIQAGGVSSELSFVALLFALFIFPRLLQRFRIPRAITCLALGALAGPGFGLFQSDTTLHLLATFGISSLFLFAGLEVNVDELRRGARVLTEHLAIRLAVLGAVAAGLSAVMDLDPRVAALAALAITTPSTGFILSSLSGLGLKPEEHFWIKSKAIATELVALVALFVTLQTTTWTTFTVSSLALVGLIAALPLVLRGFAAWIAPHAPKSDFAFLVMLGVVCAYVTRQLGAYYLVGAFVAGLAANRFRDVYPAIGAAPVINAVEIFAMFFIPFYFFSDGVDLRREDFGVPALLVGVGFLAIFLPLRVALVVVHRRLRLQEKPRQSLPIAVHLLPTLVFTLVLAEILRDDFGASPALFGGLIVYTVVNTLVPSIVYRAPAPSYDEPHADEAHPPAKEAAGG